jgi:hypothetical protein
MWVIRKRTTADHDFVWFSTPSRWVPPITIVGRHVNLTLMTKTKLAYAIAE